ncbi:hypothetical protein T1E_1264 [Pseudomonas putida DOT-T1E]|uniref:Uncharacterized protein n=1 Tax=Pseudomonas putida (strain DOT-T1E) TaxID=1196325 RepID=I7C232_PSEPT|nr:hypothetical protein T1E_1264 [Pseudomonas putida DOT-T1E]
MPGLAGKVGLQAMCWLHGVSLHHAINFEAVNEQWVLNN